MNHKQHILFQGASICLGLDQEGDNIYGKVRRKKRNKSFAADDGEFLQSQVYSSISSLHSCCFSSISHALSLSRLSIGDGTIG
jgi:hypothetical protein